MPSKRIKGRQAILPPFVEPYKNRLTAKKINMKRILATCFCLLLAGTFTFAQRSLAVIKASSTAVNIRCDGVLYQQSWRISPTIKPDVYITSAKVVTFYTDRDSISFKVKPNRTISFIILLNGKDTALTQIQYKPSYLDVLKKAGKYNYSDNRKILPFTYQTPNDTLLKAIRQKFRLDSVAGSGNEISQVLNLLHWVHNTYPHDGNREVPEFSTTLELMTYCKDNHTTMHCGALANVLNECYAAMGLKSRRVICMPKDSTDFECHSINSVYSQTLNKWVWIDPTNDAYVMNEQGVLLGIQEVRERLVNGRPLILNPDANYNHKFSIEKKDYLYSYMAKNLYALQCYVEAEGESVSNVLLPVEYTGILPRTAENRPRCTNNPDVFWIKPE